MGRPSKREDRIVIYCPPEVHRLFYEVKRAWFKRRGRVSNAVFLAELLELAKAEIDRLRSF